MMAISRFHPFSSNTDSEVLLGPSVYSSIPNFADTGLVKTPFMFAEWKSLDDESVQNASWSMNDGLTTTTCALGEELDSSSSMNSTPTPHSLYSPFPSTITNAMTAQSHTLNSEQTDNHSWQDSLSAAHSSSSVFPAVSTSNRQRPLSEAELVRVDLNDEVLRLQQQRCYDAKRRQNNKNLFNHLRQALKSAESLTKDGAKFLLQSEESVGWNCGIHTEKKQQESNEFQEESINNKRKKKFRKGNGNSEKKLKKNDDEEEEDSEQLKKKAETERRRQKEREEKGIAEFSRRELIVAAANTIRTLLQVKKKLEKKFQRINFVEGADDENTILPVEKIESLMRAYSFFQNAYSQQLSALRALESSSALFRPPSLFQHLFGELSMLGLDGRIPLMLEEMDWPKNGNSMLDQSWRWFDDAERRGFHLRKFYRDPYLSLMHSFCFLLRNGFQYHDTNTTVHIPYIQWPAETAPTPSAILHAAVAPVLQDIAVSRSQALQFFYSTLQTANSHPASSSLTPASACYDATSHPLYSYSLPAAAFHSFVETLQFLLSLGPTEYAKQIETLRPMAQAAIPAILPSRKALCLPLVNCFEAQTEVSESFASHPLYTLSFNGLQALYELYSGQKNVVRMMRCMPSPTGRLLYLTTDVALIRDPVSQLPLVHAVLPRHATLGPSIEEAQKHFSESASM